MGVIGSLADETGATLRVNAENGMPADVTGRKPIGMGIQLKSVAEHLAAGDVETDSKVTSCEGSASLRFRRGSPWRAERSELRAPIRFRQLVRG